MFTRFVCTLLGFFARKFPENFEKNLNIYFWPKVVVLVDNKDESYINFSGEYGCVTVLYLVSG